MVCASVQTRYSQELKDEDGAVVLSPGYTMESHGLDTTPVMMGVGGRRAWLGVHVEMEVGSIPTVTDAGSCMGNAAA